MGLKKIILSMAAAAAVAGASLPASASCWFTARPTHLFAQVDVGYGMAYLYNGTYFTYFRIRNDDAEVLAQMTAAAAAGRNITVRGDAASCPGSGTYRNGGYATYTYLWMGP